MTPTTHTTHLPVNTYMDTQLTVSIAIYIYIYISYHAPLLIRIALSNFYNLATYLIFLTPP